MQEPYWIPAIPIVTNVKIRITTAMPFLQCLAQPAASSLTDMHCAYNDAPYAAGHFRSARRPGKEDVIQHGNSAF
jgi:hypothetical protein